MMAIRTSIRCLQEEKEAEADEDEDGGEQEQSAGKEEEEEKSTDKKAALRPPVLQDVSASNEAPNLPSFEQRDGTGGRRPER